ncbi:MAG: aminotransferase class I/II-fold pyridoxal phosphate-dependent enzyme [Alphaproteobacteria bacterium]|nr:aminotransferase class I/II-fold pyridoxal phosphate-dependent enzyme [Alphaproteobacteria bacterium]
MPIDVGAQYRLAEDTAELATSPFANGLRGSSILAIAAEVRKLRAEGRAVHDLTIGDFDPRIFPVPDALVEGIGHELAAGQTNYPPAVGLPELRQAVTALYKRTLDVEIPEEAVIVGSGARPPLYAAFAAIVAEGDTVVYPVPSWNVNHYCYLTRARGIPIVTKPEQGFMLTAEDVAPHLRTARLVALNSPQNPSGTVVTEAQLTRLCDAILAENTRRRGTGERPVILLYDAVYWRLTFGDAVHLTPFVLRPAIAPYTVMVDAISKWWAATGLRVGWAVAPPWIRARMQAIIGHVGAWAGRPEQLATARLLREPERTGDFLAHFKRQIRARLELLQRGIDDMGRDGLPVRALEVQGAIYLSVQVGLHGRTTPDGTLLETDEDVRRYLLHQAGVAVVPFTAFGYPEGSGWIRLSVGSVTMEAVQATLAALREALTPFAEDTD